jgi:hypothetical protein
MSRSNWKDIPQWIERKKKPLDKFGAICCTVGKRINTLSLQPPTIFGKFDERRGRWKSKRKKL